MPRTKQCRRTHANGSTSAKVARPSCDQNRAIVVCSARLVRCRALQYKPVATRLAAAPKRRGSPTQQPSTTDQCGMSLQPSGPFAPLARVLILLSMGASYRKKGTSGGGFFHGCSHSWHLTHPKNPKGQHRSTSTIASTSCHKEDGASREAPTFVHHVACSHCTLNSVRCTTEIALISALPKL